MNALHFHTWTEKHEFKMMILRDDANNSLHENDKLPGVRGI